MGKTRENTSMATEESHKQNRSDRWSKERRQEQKHQKYKGRVVLRGDKAKDDHALTQYVFAEQGSSVSQMTAAKVMDVKARLPGCAGQALRLHPKSKWEMHRHHWKSQKPECPDSWIRLRKHKWPDSWSSMEDSVVPLERYLYGHPRSRTALGERQFEKCLKGPVGQSFQTGNLFCKLRIMDYSCLCVDVIKLAGQKTLDHHARYSRKTLMWENQHHSLAMFIWVALNWSAKRAKILTANHRICLNPGSPKEQKKNYPDQGDLEQATLQGFMMSSKEMCGAVLASSATQYTKAQLHALTTINSKKKIWYLMENCQKHAHRLSSNVCTGCPASAWSLNFRPRFFLCVRRRRFIFPINCRMKGEGSSKLGWAAQISSSFWSKIRSFLKIYHNMTDSMTLSTDTDGTTYSETWSTSGIRKTKYACTVEADESTNYNIVHKFNPMPQAMKILETKAAADK